MGTEHKITYMTNACRVLTYRGVKAQYTDMSGWWFVSNPPSGAGLAWKKWFTDDEWSSLKPTSILDFNSQVDIIRRGIDRAFEGKLDFREEHS